LEPNMPYVSATHAKVDLHLPCMAPSMEQSGCRVLERSETSCLPRNIFVPLEMVQQADVSIFCPSVKCEASTDDFFLPR